MIVANPASAQSPTRPGLARHLTGVGEWLRIGEAAILAADARDEWIEGEIIDRPAIGPAHAGEAHRSTAIPCEAVHDRAGGSERNSIPLGRFSAPRPDVAVSRHRDDDYEPSPPAAPGVLSLIEVADIQLATTAAASLRRAPAIGSWRSGSSTSPADWTSTGPRMAPDTGGYKPQFWASEVSSVQIATLPRSILHQGPLVEMMTVQACRVALIGARPD